MSPLLLIVAALDGAAFVVLGAAGSHGTITDPDLQRLFDTANAYHGWHALALLGVGFGLGHLHGPARRLAWTSAGLFLVGTLLFCGPLYLRAFLETSAFGPLAPIGGGMLIVGWLLLVMAGLANWRRPS